MRPLYSILVDGKDYTAQLAERLVSLVLTDIEGQKSDYIEIALDDREPHLAAPDPGAVIQVALGYAGQPLVAKGAYTHTDTDFAGPPASMVIRADAANLQRAFRARRTRSFDDITLADLLAGVAASHGYSANISPELAAQRIEHLDQVEESDIALLTRVVRDRGGVFKSTGGALVAIAAGSGRNALGQLLPAVTIRPKGLTRWNLSYHETTRAGAVVAKWQDFAAARLERIQAGTGTPVIELPALYPNATEAYAAASAELQRRARSSANGSLTMPGDPNLMADGRLLLEGFRPKVDGEYTIHQVTHTIGRRGYTSRVEFERKRRAAESGDGAGGDS
jgi:phage protein D